MSDKRWIKVGVPLLIAVLVGWWMLGGGRSPDEEVIKKLLLEGKTAWEAKDLEGFMGFFQRTYADRSGLGYGELLLIHRERMFKERCQLRADIQDVDVKVAGNKATVTFTATASRDCGDGPRTFVGEPNRGAPILLELEKSGTLKQDWKVARSSGAVNAENL